MNVETRHKIFRSALSVPLAACVALCVSVAPDEKAYADDPSYNSSVLSYLNSIYTYQQWIYGSVGDTAGQGGPFATLVESANAIYDALEGGIRVTVNGYYNNTDRTLLQEIRALWSVDSTQIGTLSQVTTPYWYLRQTYGKIDMILQSLQAWSNEIGNNWYSNIATNLYSSTTFLGNILGALTDTSITINGNTYHTPNYYLNQINTKLQSLNGYVDGLETTESSILTAINGVNNSIGANTDRYILFSTDGQSGRTQSFYNSWNTAIASLITNIRNVKTGIDNIAASIGQGLERWWLYSSSGHNGSNDKFYNSWNTAIASIIQNLNTTNTNLSTLHSDFATLGNTISTKIDQILQLMTMPNQSAADALIGNFDTDAFDDNMENLNEEIAGIGVFGSITVLGTYIEIMTDVDELEEPQMVVPFQFGGFQNQSVVVDMTWLDGLKPAINYFLMFMLVMGLTFMTWEAVKMT